MEYQNRYTRTHLSCISLARIPYDSHPHIVRRTNYYDNSSARAKNGLDIMDSRQVNFLEGVHLKTIACISTFRYLECILSSKISMEDTVCRPHVLCITLLKTVYNNSLNFLRIKIYILRIKN